MATPGIDQAQSRAAKIAGWAGLLSLPFVLVANFGIYQRLSVVGDAAQTARNIVASEGLFRVAIACDLIYAAGLILLAPAFYVILRPVDRNLALIAAFWRFVYALMWIRIILNLFDALRLVSDVGYLKVFGPGQMPALARAYLSAGVDDYYVGLLFWSLAATACAYLWLRSRYIPRPFAAFGVVASAWCVLRTLLFILNPGFQKVVNLWWFDSPLALFEIALSFWLLIRGLKPPAVVAARA